MAGSRVTHCLAVSLSRSVVVVVDVVDVVVVVVAALVLALVLAVVPARCPRPGLSSWRCRVRIRQPPNVRKATRVRFMINMRYNTKYTINKQESLRWEWELA